MEVNCRNIPKLVHIWNTEELPQEWKESIIVPIHNNCGHRYNYRGISLHIKVSQIYYQKWPDIEQMNYGQNVNVGLGGINRQPYI